MAKRIVKALDKIIKLSFVGKIEQGDLEAVEHKLKALHAAKMPNVLVDLNQLELPDSTSESEMKRLLNNLCYAKMALFGNEPQTMTRISHVLKSITETTNVKLFKDEDLARQWLLNPGSH